MKSAKQAAQNAYAPYSGFSVGAAVLCEDGAVYSGANVENASYGLSCCAERVAIFKAVSAGYRTFSAIAVIGGSPCGACRQVIYEFAPDASIIVERADGKRVETTIGHYLPDAFGPELYKKDKTS